MCVDSRQSLQDIYLVSCEMTLGTGILRGHRMQVWRQVFEIVASFDAPALPPTPDFMVIVLIVTEL